jgi:Undecaprenyl-phosphate glucose phosphotransferase
MAGSFERFGTDGDGGTERFGRDDLAQYQRSPKSPSSEFDVPADGPIDRASPTLSSVEQLVLPRGARTVSPPIVCGLLRGYDSTWVFFSALLSLYIYGRINPDYTYQPILFVLIALVAAFSADIVFGSLRLYEFASFSRPRWAIVRLAAAWIAIVLAGMAIAFLTRTSTDFSRIWAVTWFAVALTGLAVPRAVLAKAAAHWLATGRLARHVAIVGAGSQGSRLFRELHAHGPGTVRVMGIFDDRNTRISADLGGAHRLGNIDALISFARGRMIDEVILALPSSAADRINHLVARLRVLPVDLRLWIDVPIGKIGVEQIDCGSGIPVAALRDRPLKHWNALQKRIEDISVSALALALLSPFFAVLAVAVKFDSPGPVLFKQKRFGFNNNVIEVLKFRTMYVDRSDLTGAQQTRVNDPRVTRIGKFLRRASIDELPQLINVVAGTMSIVGPRPHPLTMRAADELYHEAVGEYFARHRVKPGITGLAQVSGCRGETDTMEKAKRRIRFDLQYIDRWSIGLDLKIILRTVAHLTRPNAY